MKIFLAILKALQQIHTENMLILVTITDKDLDCKEFKQFDEQFDKIMRDIK